MLSENLLIQQSLVPDGHTTGAHNGAPVDLTNADRAVWAVLAGANGSSGTVDVQIQEGALGLLLADLDAAQDTSIGLDDETNTELGFAFTTPDHGGCVVTGVTVLMKRVGTIAAGKKVTCTLQADDTGPDDTDLVTPVEGSVAPDLLSTSAFQPVTFTFPAPVALAADTTYWVVIEADFTPAAANHVAIAVDTVASGGNVIAHTTDWQSLVTTQTGCVNVHGVDFSDVEDAESTQVTEANDNGVHLVEVPVRAAAPWQRPVATVGTATCEFAVVCLAEAGERPVAQDHTVVSV